HPIPDREQRVGILEDPVAAQSRGVAFRGTQIRARFQLESHAGPGPYLPNVEEDVECVENPLRSRLVGRVLLVTAVRIDCAARENGQAAPNDFEAREREQAAD